MANQLVQLTQALRERNFAGENVQLCLTNSFDVARQGAALVIKMAVPASRISSLLGACGLSVSLGSLFAALNAMNNLP